MALPTGGYTFTPQTASIGASPLSALKPLDVGVSVSFTPMPKYEVPSAQQELVSIGAAKGLQGFSEPIIKAFKDKEDEKKAAELLKGKYAQEEKIAGIRAAKTARELQMEELRYQDLEKRVNERGGNKGDETINYGGFDDETPIGDSFPANPEADVSSTPSLFDNLENSDFLGQINPTQEKVAALWNTPLAELTASAGTAGSQQEQGLLATYGGKLAPQGQAMSTDAQPQAPAPAPEEPRFGLMAKFRGLYTPEEAKKMRAEFSGKMTELSGDGKMEPVPSGVGYQFDKPMRDVAPVRVEKAIPVAQASQVTAKPRDISKYVQAWADPSVASSAADKVAEIMGSEYAYPEITQFKNKSGDVGYRVNIPKKLTRKEIDESETSKQRLSVTKQNTLNREQVNFQNHPDVKAFLAPTGMRQSIGKFVRDYDAIAKNPEAAGISDIGLLDMFARAEGGGRVTEGQANLALNSMGLVDKAKQLGMKLEGGDKLSQNQRDQMLRVIAEDHVAQSNLANQQVEMKRNQLKKQGITDENDLPQPFILPQTKWDAEEEISQMKNEAISLNNQKKQLISESKKEEADKINNQLKSIGENAIALRKKIDKSKSAIINLHEMETTPQGWSGGAAAILVQ